MILLPNVYVDVFRSSYTASTGTDVAAPYLYQVSGHISRMKDAVLVPYPSSVLRAEYRLFVDVSVDIQRGDVVMNIRRMDSGKLWFTGMDTETWRVLDATNTAPGFNEYRDVILGRFVASGPVQ